MEFMGATVNIKDLLTEDKLDELMKQIDLDGNKKITSEEIRKAFTKFGKELDDQDLEEIMRVHDTNGDGVISRQEFRDIFNN